MVSNALVSQWARENRNARNNRDFFPVLSLIPSTHSRCSHSTVPLSFHYAELCAIQFHSSLEMRADNSDGIHSRVETPQEVARRPLMVTGDRCIVTEAPNYALQLQRESPFRQCATFYGIDSRVLYSKKTLPAAREFENTERFNVLSSFLCFWLGMISSSFSRNDLLKNIIYDSRGSSCGI